MIRQAFAAILLTLSVIGPVYAADGTVYPVAPDNRMAPREIVKDSAPPGRCVPVMRTPPPGTDWGKWYLDHIPAPGKTLSQKPCGNQPQSKGKEGGR